eukprot:scaffold7242_cov400-Prasinococcus_capsulatus_cf.AAC.17
MVQREAKKCLKGKKDIVLWGGTDVEASPLLHFCSYLCLSIERRSRALADFLVGKYQPALARDPSLAVAIEHCLAERVPSPRQADGMPMRRYAKAGPDQRGRRGCCTCSVERCLV